jgi:hypothetical protein
MAGLPLASPPGLSGKSPATIFQLLTDPAPGAVNPPAANFHSLIDHER